MRHTPRGASCLADAHQSSCRNGQFRLPLTRVGPLTACPRIAAASCVSAGTCASASPVRPPAVFRTQLMLRPRRAWTRTQIHGDFSRADTTAMRGPRRGFCLVSVVTSITRILGHRKGRRPDSGHPGRRVGSAHRAAPGGLPWHWFLHGSDRSYPNRLPLAEGHQGQDRSCSAWFSKARAPRLVHRGWCTEGGALGLRLCAVNDACRLQGSRLGSPPRR